MQLDSISTVSGDSSSCCMVELTLGYSCALNSTTDVKVPWIPACTGDQFWCVWYSTNSGPELDHSWYCHEVDSCHI